MDPADPRPADDPRKFLEQRILRSDKQRVQFDYEEFFTSERYKDFERLAIGTMTVTDMKTKTRYIDSSLWPYTEWELAREYLRWIFESQAGERTKRVGWNRETFRMLKVHQPLFFERPERGELCYLDISSAYWQLYNCLTLDVYFNPWRKAFGLGQIRFLCKDWLRAQRTVRNALIGIVRSKEHYEYHPAARTGKGVVRLKPGSPWVIRRTYNKFLAPELWGFIVFYLHQIAAFLHANYDIFYIHTDGYILPQPQARDAIEAVMDRFKVSLAVKAAGHGEVTGIGRWKIEDRGTKNYGDGKPVKYLMDYDTGMQTRMSEWRAWAIDISSPGPEF